MLGVSAPQYRSAHPPLSIKCRRYFRHKAAPLALPSPAACVLTNSVTACVWPVYLRAMSELGSEADQDRDDSGYYDEDRPRRRVKICMEYENGEKIFPLQRSLIGWVAGTSAGFERKSKYAAAKATAYAAQGTTQRSRS